MLYILYRIAYFLALMLPLKAAYWLACRIAGLWCRISRKDRMVIMNNMKTVLGDRISNDRAKILTKEVFRNFAKYLVDFFRFSLIDREFIKKFVKVDGLSNLDEALRRGKGVIALSAHIGNWELGGAVLPSIGYPTSAVVLSHQDKNINEFFKRQRLKCRMKPIEIGISLKSCYVALKNNEVLALLGDRDFTKNGIAADFFGKKASIPKGPAVFSYRIGSAIVPTFMLREDDDTFRFVFDKPIYPNTDGDERAETISLTKKIVSVMEDYVRRYPTQWYVFKDIWSNDEFDVRPDTVL
ncbi:MAG: lysophospholipid acyltransferase family protein [Candidatus Omnitrophota bacterium]|nr:lysophospholipid acyltransferase family protein [Candidatus Omnitrophota bacterium]